MNFDAKAHWEKVYQEKSPDQVSWYQVQPSISLNLIAESKINRDAKIIDIGGGASLLVDKLLEKGFNDITILDISNTAIQQAKKRLGDKADKITWVASDITEFESSHLYDLWHDRAVFHFLTDESDRKKYIERMKKAVKLGGQVIMATFALEGPQKCSGLDVQRYNSEKLNKEIGKSFTLIKSMEECHLTPWNTEQKFSYSLFNKVT